MTPALTREAVEKMEAGPEMDALVAERIFGQPYKRVTAIAINDRWVEIPTWIWKDWDPAKPPAGTWAGQVPPTYSSSIAAAWEVVEKMVSTPRGQDADGFIIEPFDNLQAPPKPYPGEKWSASFYHYDGSRGSVGAETAPLAICRAALLATL